VDGLAGMSATLAQTARACCALYRAPAALGILRALAPRSAAYHR